MALELVTPFTKVELEKKEKDKNRKQIGILGGNFNPVHNAHLVVADQVRQQLCLDKVLLMPEYAPPHLDKKETIDEKHRLKMLELAIEGVEGLDIETIELERKGISYTYDTMKLLIEKNPDVDGVFTSSDIIGAYVLQACRDLSISVPQNMKIVGFDDVNIAQFTTPGLTTIHQPVEQMAEQAISDIAMIDAGKVVPSRTVFPVTLVERGTT